MLVRRGVKLAHLRLLAALAETGQVGAAAGVIGITQPAASRLMAEAERITGVALHQRTGRGVTLTPAGVALARRAGRVLLEVEDAGRELAEIAGGRAGMVRLGAVTGPAMEMVLPALARARQDLPELEIEVVVATSDVLGEGVMAGRLDFALARLPGPGPMLTGTVGQLGPFSFRQIADEPVALMVRRGHPLLQTGAPLSPAALMTHDWVMPGPEAILRQSVLARLRALGLPDPPGRVATASFLLTLAILDGSDAIAPLAEAVANRFAHRKDATFATLPVDLGIRVAPFGVVTRAGARLTPSAARMLALIEVEAGGRSPASARSR